MATGASTNLMIHLIAIARRAGVDLTLDDFDRLSRETPFIANVKPSGERHRRRAVPCGRHRCGDEGAGTLAGYARL